MKKLRNMKDTCAPCALQYVSKRSDGAVIEACLSYGMTDKQWLGAAEKLGIKLKQVHIKPKKTRKFLQAYSKGTFLVRTVDHLFVIDNGKIIDPGYTRHDGMYRTLIQAWRVLK